MFTDEQRFEVFESIRQHGFRAFASKITPEVLQVAAERSSTRLVRSALCVKNLVWLSIAAALHKADDFSTVLVATLKILMDHQGFGEMELGKASAKKLKNNRTSKHDPRGTDPTRVSEEAFVQARHRMPQAFWVALIVLLGENFQKQHSSLLKFREFRLIAVDGTTIQLPNWKSLRDHFGTSKGSASRQRALARMVMMQFPLVRIPYRYQLCPVSEGETSIARRLTPSLQLNDLVLLDACFWSYGLFWDIQNRDAFFAIPMKGKNIRFKRAGRLAPKDELVRWTPKDSRQKWKKEKLPDTIELRVISYQLPGFRAQKLITNMLDANRIPRQDWIRLTTECSTKGELKPGLYHRRWEIETTFRELKVDQGMEGHLRSRTPESIQYEVAGHVVLYLLVRWMMVEAAVKKGLDPLRLSFTHALREMLEMRSALVVAQPQWAQVLIRRLLERFASHQVPYRPGRSYPRTKQSTNYKTKPPKPKIQSAKKTSKSQAKKKNVATSSTKA